MKLHVMRLIMVCMIISVLCAGALFQYMTTNRDNHTNAVMVAAFLR